MIWASCSWKFINLVSIQLANCCLCVSWSRHKTMHCSSPLHYHS